MVQIAEYSAEDAKLRKVISYCKIAAIFLAIGIVLGRAVS